MLRLRCVGCTAYSQLVSRLVDLGAAELEDREIPMRRMQGVALIVALALGVARDLHVPSGREQI